VANRKKKKKKKEDRALGKGLENRENSGKISKPGGIRECIRKSGEFR